MMNGSVFWSIIFFLMLITLGLDSTFGGLEAMVTALCDEYPRALGRRRELFVMVLLLAIYLCALPTTTYVSVFVVNRVKFIRMGDEVNVYSRTINRTFIRTNHFYRIQNIS